MSTQELTISRADLIEITTRTLEEAPDSVTDEQKLEMCDTAHKMDSVLAGSWVSTTCGCLIGTCYRDLFPRNGGNDPTKVEEIFGHSIYQVSAVFDVHLKNKLRERGFKAYGNKQVRVID